MKQIDVVILTDRRFIMAEKGNSYSENIVLEDNLVKTALEKKGLKVIRLAWDDPDFMWSKTRFALFRTTWDYFSRFDEFDAWFDKTARKTQFINVPEIIYKNRDKHYLIELQKQGINIPPTLIIEKNSTGTLRSITGSLPWEEFILKPVISGAARHTYRFRNKDIASLEDTFRQLIAQEDMMLQEFQKNILTQGEISLIFFGNNYSHAVLKKGKSGDFRVQDDFGGTVQIYEPSGEEIDFACRVLDSCPVPPLYARVDILRDNENKPALGELELIEPELWFRFNKDAAEMFASEFIKYTKRTDIFS